MNYLSKYPQLKSRLRLILLGLTDGVSILLSFVTLGTRLGVELDFLNFFLILLIWLITSYVIGRYTLIKFDDGQTNKIQYLTSLLGSLIISILLYSIFYWFMGIGTITFKGINILLQISL